MPEDAGGEKSEQPTPKKLQNAREEGQVARSPEVSSGGLLLTGFLTFMLLGPAFYRGFHGLATFCLRDGLDWEIDAASTVALFGNAVAPLAGIMLLYLAILFAVAVLLGFGQVGVFITAKPLVPKFSRVNPVTGLQRLFGLRGLMRFLFSFIKLVLIIAVAYFCIREELPDLFYFKDNLEEHVVQEVWMLLLLALKLTGVLLVVAGLDFLYQRYQHTRDLMMTKQEIKDEFKQTDGDPLVRSRIRQLQREMAQQRMMEEVPQADVVITNPTHVAVALRYEQVTMAAPIVVAKGYDLVAQSIKGIAAEHDVPQVENVELARALARGVRIGQEVPVEFYQAVAEVLSVVYRLQAQR